MHQGTSVRPVLYHPQYIRVRHRSTACLILLMSSESVITENYLKIAGLTEEI